MKKVIPILILLSLVLPFSLFTIQADASTMIGTTSWAAGAASTPRLTGPAYLETKYVTSVTGTLQQINLAIVRLSIPLGNPLKADSDFLNFTCWANGVNLTGADSISWPYSESYGWGSYDYGVLTWNCSQVIAGAPLVFEFRHSAINISYRHSVQSGAPETADLNGDGNYSLYEHNTPANFGDGVVNGYTHVSGLNEVGLSFLMGGTYTPPAAPPVAPTYTVKTFGTIGWLPNEGSYKHTLTRQWVEHGNYIKQTGFIRQVDLGVWSTEIIGADKNLDPTDFGSIWLYIDNQGPYNPTNITWPEVYLDSNGYERAIGILTWYGLNVSVSNEYTIFELKQSLPSGLIFRMGAEGYDLDGDGLTQYRESTGSQNGLVDGLWPYNYDPAFRFMIAVPDTGTGGLETIGQGLDIQPSVIKTKTSMFINYAVNSLANPLHLDIYDGSANVTDQGCPYTIPVYYGTFVYNPQVAGAYIIYLSNATNVVQSHVHVTVSANTETDWIQAIPPMGSFINPVRLNYKYSKAVDGVIGVFDSMAETNALSNAIDTIGGITPAGTYNLTVMPLNTAYSENKIYYRLFTNGSEPVSGVGTFVIYTVIENKLTPQYSPLLTGSEVFSYAHNFVNAKVGVFVDGIKIQDIGDQKRGSFSYTFETQGFKQIDMRVYLGGTWITITNFTLNVSGSAIVIPPEHAFEWWDVSGILGSLWSAVLGLALVIGCLMIPTILSIKYKKDIKFPQLAYVMLGCVGIAISIVLGLWPIWVVVFLITMVIVVAVFLYVFKTSSRSDA
jgi:hypothetical protein